MRIKVKYLDPKVPRLAHIGGKRKSNWVDVYASRIEIDGKMVDMDVLQDMALQINERCILRVFLGFALQLPAGYEAHIAPRSSTFRNTGLIMTNSIGIVDESFCGDGDEWFTPFWGAEPGLIKRYDRIAQFRIVEAMPDVEWVEVDKLGNADRGGYGSTG